MSAEEQQTTVTFLTRPANITLTNIGSHLEGAELVKRADGGPEGKEYNHDPVTAVSLRGGEMVANPDHSDYIDHMQFMTDQAVTRELTLPNSRAVRLVEAFRLGRIKVRS